MSHSLVSCLAMGLFCPTHFPATVVCLCFQHHALGVENCEQNNNQIKLTALLIFENNMAQVFWHTK